MDKSNITERRYMKMKTITLMLGLVLVASLLAVPMVLAEETDAETALENTEDVADTLTGDPGMTPDSALYGLKTGWEKLRIAFTFNQEKKAQLEIELAERKLLEVKKMAEKGNTKAMERAQERHDALIESAQERLDSLQEDSDESKINATAEKVVGLERAIKAHENRIEVLKEVLAEQNLSDEARTAVESAISRMENRTQMMEQKAEEKKEKIKTRLRAVSEKSEAEVEDAIEKIENKTGLTDLDKKIAEKRIEKTEEALNKLKERVAEEKKSGLNLSAVDAQIAEAEATLADAKVLFEEGNYSEVIVMLKPIGNYGRNLSHAVREINKARVENHTEELKQLINETRDERIQFREQIKESFQEGVEEWRNLSDDTQEEIKTAVKQQLRDRLGSDNETEED